MLPAVSAVRRELTLYRSGADIGTDPSAVVTIPTPPAALSTGHIELMLAAAIAGLGIAGLPSFVVEEALRDSRLERVLPQWRGASLTLYAATPTRKHAPARTRAFVDFLVSTFGGSDGDPWLTVD